MTASLDVSVTLKGGLFGKNIPRVVENALVGEALDKIDQRMSRPRQGRGLGARRNTIRTGMRGLQLDVHSTLRNPRQTGKSWQRKNIAIVKSMSGRVIRKAAERMAAELS